MALNNIMIYLIIHNNNTNSYEKIKVLKGIRIMYKARQFVDKKVLLNLYSYIYNILFIALRQLAILLFVTYILYFYFKKYY